MLRKGVSTFSWGDSLALVIDGSQGEGGGQILRVVLALSSLLGVPVRIENIRAGRPKPGLKPSHLAALSAVSSISSASLTGDAIGSTAVEFSPGMISGGHFKIDTGTAGSISLIIQALLPVMIFSGKSFFASIKGGTDVAWSPTIDHTKEVLLPLLRDAGAEVELSIERRGYYPKGGGIVNLRVSPSEFAGINPIAPPEERNISGRLHISGLPAHIGKRLMESASSLLSEKGIPVDWNIESPEDMCRQIGCSAPVPRTQSPGVSAGVWHSGGGHHIGSFSIGKKGVSAERIGGDIAESFLAEFESGASVDIHLGDQILIYMAMAMIKNKRHSSFSVRELTGHTLTNMAVIEKMTPLSFVREKKADLWQISV